MPDVREGAEMTNWEWLLELAKESPDELQAWLHAGRVGVVDATERLRDATEMTDSREKLEADVFAAIKRAVGNGSLIGFGIINGWLDRQAEITAEESAEAWEDYSDSVQREIAELQAERDEAVEAYDAHMAAHDAWHEAEDITYTRNRFTIVEQAKNERIAALEAERDYWRGQMERCVVAAVKPERYAEGVMGYPRDELRFA
jgi:hypothetical protein